MDSVQDNNFIVYVRLDRNHAAQPEGIEQPLKVCSSYAEAREIQRQYRRAYQECVIRYEGVSGGGD